MQMISITNISFEDMRTNFIFFGMSKTALKQVLLIYTTMNLKSNKE